MIHSTQTTPRNPIIEYYNKMKKIRRNINPKIAEMKATILLSALVYVEGMSFLLPEECNLAWQSHVFLCQNTCTEGLQVK